MTSTECFNRFRDFPLAYIGIYDILASIINYRIFDNITILCAIQFFKRDPKPSNKLGMLFWFLALIFGLIIALRDLIVI
jgi:hypothetical protein